LPEASNNIIKSVVLITGSTGKFGTGFVFHSKNEYIWILTCAHVVRNVGGGPGGTVWVDDRRVVNEAATVVACGKEHEADLAVLQTTERENGKIPAVKIGLVGKEDLLCSITGFVDYTKFYYKVEPIEGKLGSILDLQAKQSGGSDKSRFEAWKLLITGGTPLKKGYSGSPVACSKTGEVFAVASYSEREGEQGCAISLASLPDVWSNMPSKLLDPGSVAGAPAEGGQTDKLETSALRDDCAAFVDTCKNLLDKKLGGPHERRGQEVLSNMGRRGQGGAQHTWKWWSDIWDHLNNIFEAEFGLISWEMKWVEQKCSEGRLSQDELDFCRKTITPMDVQAQHAKICAVSNKHWGQDPSDERIRNAMLAVYNEHKYLQEKLLNLMRHRRCPQELVNCIQRCIRDLEEPLELLLATVRAKNEEGS
jgi:hypothetical protein